MGRLQTLKPRLQTISTLRAPMIDPGSWRSGKTTAERGYGSRWQTARERHLRAYPLCCMCENEGRVAVAKVVDHKIPHRGDQTLFWDESNWQSLCAHHHSSEKQRQEREQA